MTNDEEFIERLTIAICVPSTRRFVRASRRIPGESLLGPRLQPRDTGRTRKFGSVKLCPTGALWLSLESKRLTYVKKWLCTRRNRFPRGVNQEDLSQTPSDRNWLHQHRKSSRKDRGLRQPLSANWVEISLRAALMFYVNKKEHGFSESVCLMTPSSINEARPHCNSNCLLEKNFESMTHWVEFVRDRWKSKISVRESSTVTFSRENQQTFHCSQRARFN